MNRVRVRNVSLIVILFYLWEGFPFAVLGLPNHYGRLLVSIFIVSSIGSLLLRSVRSSLRLSEWERLAVLLFSYIFFVSFVYSGILEPQPVDEWLFSLYGLTPVLLVIALRPYGITSSEAIRGLVIVGVSAAFIVLVDAVLAFPFMEVYQRAATTDESLRRIVFLKTEAALVLSVLAVRWLEAVSTKERVRVTFFLVPVLVSVFVLSESRLAIAASLLGVALYVLFVQKGRARRRGIVIGIAFAVIVLPFLLEKYVNQFVSSDNYFESDQSNSFRLLELLHFYKYFLDTYGFGFGSMSIGEGKENFVAWSAHSAGYLHGTWDYGLQLSDLGLYAAFLQYGVLGGALVLYMTLKCSRFLMRAAKASSAAGDAGVLGTTMLAFILSPWPVNFFSLEWTVFCGGFLWFLASTLSREGKRFPQPNYQR